MKWKLGTRTTLVASLLATAVAMPVWGDTLVLRNGMRYSGTLISANSRTITFREDNGQQHRYSVNDVETVQFGDASYASNDREDHHDQGSPRQNYPNDDQRNRNQDNRSYDRNQDNGSFDQSAIERAVLPAGTEVAVRTNERIDSREAGEGQTYSAQVAEDILDANGSVLIPRGSDVRLMTRKLDNDGEITLDVDSITVHGRRYRVSTTDQQVGNRREGIGKNKRTGEYVGGGALLGAIIGAIAGGGKGAAIGAVSGAGAGAATQIITRGKEVRVPAESVLRFRLDQPLRLEPWS